MIPISARTQSPYHQLMYNMIHAGHKVDTGHWQAQKDVPHTRTIELQNVVVEMPIQPTPGSWASFIQPNLPWAEDHFKERVAGEPTNPGKEYRNWPWFDPSWKAQKCSQCGNKGMVDAGSIVACPVCGNNDPAPQFSHTYQERIWPREAAEVPFSHLPMQGIRYRYGDLADVLDLLSREPHTRQAYIPIWFPEDTGAHHGERVPCTLGYHLMLREDKLHCFYPMRSVDLVRYFRDDAYMAGRLVQWVIKQLNGDAKWATVDPGCLTMFMSSLHVFEDEMAGLRRKHDAATR